MDENSNNFRVNRWIKAAWIIGWITGITWILFSTYLLVTGPSDENLIFDPALVIKSLICTIQNHQLSNQSLFDTMTWCFSSSFDRYPILRLITHLLLVGGLTYGVIKKNRVCVILLLVHPFLNFFLSIPLGGMPTYYAWYGLLFFYLFIFYSIFTLLLLIGALGTFLYLRAIKSASSDYKIIEESSSDSI